MKILPIHAALLALLFVFLSVRTIRMRRLLRIDRLKSKLTSTSVPFAEVRANVCIARNRPYATNGFRNWLPLLIGKDFGQIHLYGIAVD